MIAIGVYSLVLVGLLNAVIFTSGKRVERAIFLMADGLILFWIVPGGALTPMLRILSTEYGLLKPEGIAPRRRPGLSLLAAVAAGITGKRSYSAPAPKQDFPPPGE